LNHLIKPHGGELVNLLVNEERADELKKESKKWISWDLTSRQIFDLELLINGGFSPLTGFMKKKDYESVCKRVVLSNGNTVWPIPIVLDVTEETVKQLSIGDKIALRDPEGVMIAVQTAEEIWEPDKSEEAEKVYGTTNKEHPGVKYLFDNVNRFYIGGKVEGIQIPEHFDFRTLRLTPFELRFNFAKRSWRKVIAFHKESHAQSTL